MTISNLVFRFILICDQAHVGLPRTRPHLCTLEASAPVGFIPNFEIEYQLLSVVDDSKYRTPREVAVAKSDIQPFPRGSLNVRFWVSSTKPIHILDVSQAWISKSLIEPMQKFDTLLPTPGHASYL
jgi:hypothetical protein